MMGQRLDPQGRLKPHSTVSLTCLFLWLSLIMGIQGLMKLISEEAPLAIKEQEMEELTGRRVAIDASMAMYQFLIAVRSSGPGGGQAAMQLMNDRGEVTSHIQGMFNRTIKMMSCGVKPVYVFDGKPPQMKGGELAKRMARRAKAEEELAAAREAGNVEDENKFSSRLVKVTRQHNEECKVPHPSPFPNTFPRLFPQ